MKAQDQFREPGLALPTLALGINLAVIAWAWWMVGPRNVSPNVAILTGAESAKASAASMEIMSSGEVLINGRIFGSLAKANDQLAILAGSNAAIVVRAPESVPSGQLVGALGQCNRAGFTDLAIALSPDSTGTLTQ